MKKALLLTLLVFITNFSQAQNWCSPGAEWHYRSYNPFIPYQDGYIRVNVISTNTIGGIVYYNLNGGFYGQMYSVNFPTTAVNVFSATIYEQNQVVFISTTGNVPFDTLVNLNASIGDKWRAAKYGTLNNHPGICVRPTVTVVDTGHVTLNGQSLKKFELVQSSIPGTTITIIDKLGGINWWLHPVYTCDVDGWGLGSFVCYSDNNFPLYQNPGYNLPCNFTTVGKEEFTLDGLELNVFPNPASDNVKIEFSGENVPEQFQLQVLDLLGKQVLFGNYSSGNSLDLAELKAGLYTISLLSDGKVFARRKLVKADR